MTKTGFLIIVSFFIFLNIILCFKYSNFFYSNCPKQEPFQIYKYNKNEFDKTLPTDSMECIFPEDSITPIDVLRIKKKYAKYSTSTVIPSSETQGFYRPDLSGFFGLYTLYDDNMKSVCGEMIIFNKGIPQNWKYDNDDIFISIDISNGDLKFFKNICLGLSENDLKQKLKDFFHYKKGITIHADIGHYASDFIIENDTISRIKIKYKENY